MVWLHNFLVCFREEKFYNGIPTLPVYKWTKTNQHFSVEDLAQILLTKSVVSSQICVEQPCYVQRNAAFVVDLHKLKDPLDIKADENGTWIRKGSPVAYVSIHKDKGVTSIFDGQKSENIPTILRYHVHIIVIRVLQIFSVSLLWLMVSMHIVDQWFECVVNRKYA